MPNPQTLEAMGHLIDKQGRAFSPFLERGMNGAIKQVPIPDVAGLKEMGLDDIDVLNDVLFRYNAIPTPDELIEEQSAYLARFNSNAGTPLYDTQMTTLKEGMAERITLGRARRVSQRLEMLAAVEGNTQQNMMYLTEGDNPCGGCEPLGGTEGTLQWFIDNHMLPGDQCYGKHLCLCQLQAVD